MNKVYKAFILSALGTMRAQLDSLESLVAALDSEQLHTPKNQIAAPNSSFTSNDFDDALGQKFHELGREIQIIDERNPV